MSLVKLEPNERFVNIRRDEYGVLHFRVQLQSGKIIPTTGSYPEHVLCKESRRELNRLADEQEAEQPLE